MAEISLSYMDTHDGLLYTFSKARELSSGIGVNTMAYGLPFTVLHFCPRRKMLIFGIFACFLGSEFCLPADIQAIFPSFE